MLLLGALRSASAQTVDRARLVIGISVGHIGGADLWDVARQPILSMLEPGTPDTFQLHRSIQPGITLNAHVTYFVSPHFGVPSVSSPIWGSR